MRRVLPSLALAALVASCAHDTSLGARQASALKLVREAEERLRSADRVIKTGEDLDRAADLLKESRDLCQEPAMAYYVDRENLEDRIAQAGARLDAARDAKLRKELAAQVPDRKEKAEAAMAEFRTAADALQDRATLDRKKAGKAREALDAATKFFEDSKRFELDPGWAAYAAGCRKELGGRTVQVTLAEALMRFVEGPVAKSAEAKALLEKGKGAKAEEKTELLTRARDTFLACHREAAELVAQVPTLGGESVQAGGQKVAPKLFAAMCEAQAKAVDGVLNPKAAKAGGAAKPPPKKK